MTNGWTGFLGAERLDRFRKRIAASLEERPQELDVEAHRRRIGALLGGLAASDFFELLGVDPLADEAQVHRAYTELARLVHPSHAEALSMRGREPALEVLFERATEAYLTLSDPDSKSRYVRELEAAGWAPRTVDTGDRAEERRREARREFRIAESLAADGKYHDAVQLLEQAVRLDPQGEYLALLGHCLAQNPHWIQEAIDRYVEAVRLEPRAADYRRELGLLFERDGHRARARRHLEAAAELDPTDEATREALERLGGPGPVEPAAGGGPWWRRLLRRLLDS